jgi:hypothetical protein
MLPKYLAEYCGTSLAMTEKHYGRFMPENADAQLALLMGTIPSAEQATDREEPRPPQMEVAVSFRICPEVEWSQRESNPRPPMNARRAKAPETQAVQGLAAIPGNGGRVPECPANGPSDPRNRQRLPVSAGRSAGHQ